MSLVPENCFEKDDGTRNSVKMRTINVSISQNNIIKILKTYMRNLVPGTDIFSEILQFLLNILVSHSQS